jgi:hypothetical protein
VKASARKSCGAGAGARERRHNTNGWTDGMK